MKTMHNTMRRPPASAASALVISSFFSLFLLGGTIAVGRNGNGVSILSVALLLICVLVWICSALVQFSLLKKKRFSAAEWMQGNRLMFLLLALAVLVRIPQWGTVPHNDGAVYYEALYDICSNFQFSPTYLINNFRLAGHPSYMYSILVSIPELFFPGSFNNIWLMQTLLSVMAVYCVYDLLHIQCGFDETHSFFGGLLFSCSSMFLGLDSYLQLDFGCTVAVIFVLWSLLRGKILLSIFSMSLLVLSKELGIALLTGMLIGIFLYYFIAVAQGSFYERFRSFLKQPALCTAFFLCLVGGLVVLYYLFGTGFAWSGAVTAEKGSGALGFIGIEPDYIRYKLIQAISTNFAWLMLALQLLCLIIRVIKKYSPLSKSTKLLLTGSICAWGLYFVLSCLIVTYTVPRYNLPLEILVVLNTAILLAATFKGIPSLVIPGVLAALLCLQGYISLDPVMAAIYPQIETGRRPMSLENLQDPENYVGDYAMYNYQYTYQNRCVTKILRAEDFDADTNLFIVPRDNGLKVGTDDRLLWDMATERWTISSPTAISAASMPVSIDFEQYEGYLIDNVYKTRAIFVITRNTTPTEDMMRSFEANLPSTFTNLQRHEMADGLLGKLFYYTADFTPDA